MKPHIVVLGAGYAGLAAAKLAARRTGARVTLVNAHDRFVERVRLHQLAAGQELTEHPLADLLAGTGVRLVVDRVTGLDAGSKRVRLAGGSEVDYDVLVYALGSHTPVPEHAFGVTGPADAARLRARLAEASTVAVVGGGLTGLETAAELAESHPAVKVRLLTSGVLGEALSHRARRYLREVFAGLGVEVREGVRAAGVRPDGVLLTGGEHVAADTVVWTTGFGVPDLARAAGFAVDDHGRMLVDETLRSVSHPDVYGIGDAAAVRDQHGRELRMACATGLPTAHQVAESVAARLAGRAARPFRFRYFNQCVSLGRRAGLVQFVRADDTPVERILTGRFAARYKEVIVRGAAYAQRRPGVLGVYYRAGALTSGHHPRWSGMVSAPARRAAMTRQRSQGMPTGRSSRSSSPGRPSNPQ
ncbi:NAD(P)/FAD-dependent oxidoreductase [Amycolatopsis thermophila]|uniref:NADH dehydrogenase FAD-containing subunit n=1 Tax=Amycolatopsis thermophila TaxID=206084 RepID=A0ABU0ELH1_9PSEU|nr:FAD-dependent oxidoreductase [Amycolatopsis thermophila]MDQ0376124.1 NADH dehydrogenase FAD-containing subunit [Amycolatopsis thermophila]